MPGTPSGTASFCEGDLLEIQENTLSVPAGAPGARPIRIDISEILHLESRKDEVSTVNKTKAPELMRAMEKGYSAAATLLTSITWEVKKAEDALEKRKAIVTLEVAPEYLKRNGLVNGRSPGGSEDQRTAVLSTDQEYLALKENVSRLEAVQNYFRVKAKGFEMSFSAIKKVYDSLSSYGMLDGGGRSFPGQNDNKTAGDTGKIGIPRY